ncbi:MAG: hypothetical protein KKB39_02110 [Nanoarchaeota archaeon]|nr:hypothetical protein [Nanoarchaeota archaeon]
MKISSRTIGILLILTLVVSSFGTLSALNRLEGFSNLFTLTGKWGIADGTNATYAAVNLTIQGNLVVNFTDDSANFGSGYVKGGYSACTIATDGTNTSGCAGFSVPNGLLLENQGSVHAKINITNSNYTNSLLGGTASGYAWMWDDPENDDATCIGGNFTGNETAWSNITAVINEANYPSNNVLCGLFNFTDASDLINISIKFHIDITALARTVSDTWLVEAKEVS